MNNNYYLMSRQMTGNGTLLIQESHDLIEFSTGHYFPKEFSIEGPFVVSLDDRFINGDMATLYIIPAVISTKQFYNHLTSLGIDNIEVHPVIIKNEVEDTENHDYVLLNIIGRITCADMNQSEYSSLGDGMNIINKLVIDRSKTHGQEFFLVHEDTDCIVISGRIYEELKEANYPDLYFEKLETV